VSILLYLDRDFSSSRFTWRKRWGNGKHGKDSSASSICVRELIGGPFDVVENVPKERSSLAGRWRLKGHKVILSGPEPGSNI
jgi:hypothetical protein